MRKIIKRTILQKQVLQIDGSLKIQSLGKLPLIFLVLHNETLILKLSYV